MKKIMIMLGTLIGAVSCTDANGSIHKTANGSVYRTVCASKYDCTEVRIENSDDYKWYHGEMSEEEYVRKHPEYRITDEEWEGL